MGRTAITILILATVLCAQVLAAEPTHCTGCIDGQPTASQTPQSAARTPRTVLLHPDGHSPTHSPNPRYLSVHYRLQLAPSRNNAVISRFYA